MRRAGSATAPVARRAEEAIARGPRARWALSRDDTLRLLPGRNGVVLRGLGGALVVTQSRDPVDHVLEAGGELRLTRPGKVVLWALSEAEVEVGRRGEACSS